MTLLKSYVKALGYLAIFILAIAGVGTPVYLLRNIIQPIYIFCFAVFISALNMAVRWLVDIDTKEVE